MTELEKAQADYIYQLETIVHIRATLSKGELQVLNKFRTEVTDLDPYDFSKLETEREEVVFTPKQIEEIDSRFRSLYESLTMKDAMDKAPPTTDEGIEHKECLDFFKKHKPLTREAIKTGFNRYPELTYKAMIEILAEIGGYSLKYCEYCTNGTPTKADYEYEIEVYLNIVNRYKTTEEKRDKEADDMREIVKMLKDCAVNAGIIDKNGNVTKEYGGK